jgi:hypothetical protein
MVIIVPAMEAIPVAPMPEATKIPPIEAMIIAHCSGLGL